MGKLWALVQTLWSYPTMLYAKGSLKAARVFRPVQTYFSTPLSFRSNFSFICLGAKDSHLLETLIQSFVSFQEHTGLQLRLIADQTAVEKRVMTPSAACLTVNNGDFNRLFGTLRLAEGEALSRLGVVVHTYAKSTIAKLPFRWSNESHNGLPVDSVRSREKLLEKSSYPRIVSHLRDMGLCAFDVSEGQRCQHKLLFVSDVHSIRPNTVLDTQTLRKRSQCPYLIQQVRGRTDIIIVANRYADAVYFTKYQVKVAIEVKTPELIKKLDACLREIAVQLVGLNTENVERTPVVLLTNLEGIHYVLYLTMGPEPDKELTYKMHVLQFKTFELALEFALIQSEKEPISAFFGKKATPPPSENSDASDENERDDGADLYDTTGLEVTFLCIFIAFL